MWHCIAAFIINFRIFLLILLLGITVFMGFQATKVRLSYDSTGAIPTDNPKYQEYQEFKKQFGQDGTMMVVGVQTAHFFEPAFFNAYNQLVLQLQKSYAIDNVFSIPTAINLVKDTVNNRLKAEKISAAVAANGNTDSLSTIFLNLPFYKGLLYNAETKAYLMALYINKDKLATKERKRIIKDVVNLCESFGKSQSIEMHYSGLPYIRTQVGNKIEAEMKFFLMLSLILTAIILLLFFRSASAVFASMIVVAVGVVWSVGTMTLLNYQITLLTALIPPLIVVIGIPNCVYFLNKYHSEYSKHGNKIKSLLRMVDRMGIVTLFTNLTAAIGFGVFFFTKSKILKEFGLIAGVNIMSLFIISLVFLPALFSYLPAPKSRHTHYLESRWLHKLLATITNWVFLQRKWIYIISGLVALISLIGVAKLKTVGYVVDDLPKKDKIYTDLKFFEKHFHGVMPLEIVIDTKRKNGAVSLPMMQKIDQLGISLASYKELGHPLSFVDGVKFARQAYYDGDSSSYGVPNMMDGAFIQPYLRAKPNESVNTGGDMFAKLLTTFMDSTKQKTRISINMEDIGSVKLPILLDSIRPITYELFDTSKYKVTFTGSSIIFLEGGKFIIHSLRDSLILAFIMIFGCMIALFYSWRILLISFTVNIIPLLATAGIMGWMGIPIKPSTVLVFSVALGITIDVTIRFLVSYKHELDRYNDDVPKTVRHTIYDTGLSIIYTSLILIVGFGVFALSNFEGTKSLGLLTSFTLLLAMLTNLTLQPAMLLWLNKAGRDNASSTKWLEDTDDEEDQSNLNP
ncbi:MAG: MMPL family transporter [Phycisphaerales bacterium]|nr:MMPL family transporter [Phycisphaerales bacterium]